MYKTFDKNKQSKQELNECKKQVELTRMRSMKKDISQQLFSYKKKPLLKKQFMNYICQSESSDEEDIDT